MFFLATADAHGGPSARTRRPAGLRARYRAFELSFPSYDGNGMFRSLGNIGVNPNVGMLFLDFEQPRRLRVNGTARLEDASAEFEGAQLIVRVKARRFSRTVRATSTVSSLSRPRSMRRGQATSRGARLEKAIQGRPARQARRKVDSHALDTSSRSIQAWSTGMDREFIARREDHSALRIWLRLLTCTQLIERRVRSGLREEFQHHAAALRPDGLSSSATARGSR